MYDSILRRMQDCIRTEPYRQVSDDYGVFVINQRKSQDDV